MLVCVHECVVVVKTENNFQGYTRPTAALNAATRNMQGRLVLYMP